jgi:UDP-N-acetylglucosamine transferase subunit ALG13
MGRDEKSISKGNKFGGDILMIFVSVGTHEQQFNRLVKEIDELVGKGQVIEDVFVQLGYSDYIPKNCSFEKLLSYEKMEEYLNRAKIVITHGGPSSFMSVLIRGKTPIVVPRKKQFNEHVNDHQLEFAKRLVEKGYTLDIVEDCSELWDAIKRNEDLQGVIKRRNQDFVDSFRELALDLVR